MCQLCSGCSSQARMICKSGRCLGHTSAAQKPNHKKGNSRKARGVPIRCRKAAGFVQYIVNRSQKQETWLPGSNRKAQLFLLSINKAHSSYPFQIVWRPLLPLKLISKRTRTYKQTEQPVLVPITEHPFVFCFALCLQVGNQSKEISFPSVWKRDVSNWINICNGTFKWPWLSCWNKMNQCRKGAGKEIFFQYITDSYRQASACDLSWFIRIYLSVLHSAQENAANF